MGIGFRICQRSQEVSREIATKFAALPVANVSDSMGRLFAGGARLRPLHKEGVLSGPALTVLTRPGDNLMIHKAIDIAAPGDVIVVDAGGDLTNALIGELMIGHAMKRGLGGIVINGAVRDSAFIAAGEFPVFAAGVTHRGPYKDGPGEINVHVALDGMVVRPGDLMLGDEDGLVCVPFEMAEEVYAKTHAKHQAELKQMQNIEAGTNDRSWVDETLRKLGCEGL